MENQILLEKIGETKTDKLIRDCENIYKENFSKKFPEYFVNKNILKSFVIVTATEKDEIKNIGMSCIDDLLVDNFGKWFGAFIYPTTTITMKDKTNVDRLMTMWSTGVTWNIIDGGGNTGSQIEVGDGVTLATRQDVDLVNSLQTLNSSDGGWNSGLGQVDIPATVPSSFSGNISEVGLFGVWYAVGGVKPFLLSRDNLSPVVPVIIGQSINADYKLLLS